MCPGWYPSSQSVLALALHPLSVPSLATNDGDWDLSGQVANSIWLVVNTIEEPGWASRTSNIINKISSNNNNQQLKYIHKESLSLSLTRSISVSISLSLLQGGSSRSWIITHQVNIITYTGSVRIGSHYFLHSRTIPLESLVRVTVRDRAVRVITHSCHVASR